MDYLKDPAAIYAKSFATIRAEVDLSELPNDVAEAAVRMIHACGMTDLIKDLIFSADVAASAAAALAHGASIITDCEMVRAGIISALLPADNAVICALNEPTVARLAREGSTTRSAAQVALWAPHLPGSVVVIGNAPTALFALLEALDAGAVRPAAIIACPVGFVGAVESKAELASNPRGVPFLTVVGRRGGSALASAALNALSQIARARVAA